MIGRRSLALAMALASVVVISPSAPLARAQVVVPLSIRRFDPDVWITLRDFRYVTSVATSDRRAYFGTSHGLERFDTLAGRWLPAVTSADGLPHAAVSAVVADPGGIGAWIGTPRGLVLFDDFGGQLEPVIGPQATFVDALLADDREGFVYARVGGVWWRGRAGSPFMDLLPGLPPAGEFRGSVAASELDPIDVPWGDPLYVESAIRPAARVRLTMIGSDLRGDIYAGTWGDNARRWGAGLLTWEALHYGLAAQVGGPVVRDTDGYWFLPGAYEPTIPGFDALPRATGRFAVGALAPLAAAHADPELNTWAYVVPELDPRLPTVVAYAALTFGDTLILATDYGLVQNDGRSWGRVPFAGEDEIGRATALAADGSRTWVGTDRGLFLWHRDGARLEGPFARAARVTSVAADADGLFVGTTGGLYVGHPDDPQALVRAATRGRRVTALAARDTVLAVATALGLEIFDRKSGRWSRTLIGEGRLTSVPTALAIDDAHVWVGSGQGLTRWYRETGEWRTYGTLDGLAGVPVTHLLAEPGVIWASTPTGVGRFDWRLADR